MSFRSRLWYATATYAPWSAATQITSTRGPVAFPALPWPSCPTPRCPAPRTRPGTRWRPAGTTPSCPSKRSTERTRTTKRKGRMSSRLPSHETELVCKCVLYLGLSWIPLLPPEINGRNAEEGTERTYLWIEFWLMDHVFKYILKEISWATHLLLKEGRTLKKRHNGRMSSMLRSAEWKLFLSVSYRGLTWT